MNATESTVAPRSPSPGWMGEAATPGAEGDRCPHDGGMLATDHPLSTLQYCAQCRRVWSKAGERQKTCWWNGP